MHSITISHRSTLFLALMVFFLSSIAILMNLTHHQYPGNLYLPSYAPLNLICFILIYAGFIKMYGHQNKWIGMTKDFIWLASLSITVTFAINAVQFTPYPTIDHQILRLETSLHIDYQQLLTWVSTFPYLKKALAMSYNLLPYQMIYLPILLIIARRSYYVHEYFFLVLTTVLIGFLVYYFFPTTAPASTINSPYFSEAQRATGLKFNQIHQHISPSTIQGGLIAFPSFHVIWGWLTLYMVRCWPLLFALLLPIYLLMVASCILLGWHYLIDIIGAVVVLIMGHAAYYRLGPPHE
ncbi:MAG: phosphatase PAP2 family protein [Legionellales bacterium]|nr:phosphatase PAP2 family protein [Legionellales bacterium]